jgi:hypothetical protein
MPRRISAYTVKASIKEQINHKRRRHMDAKETLNQTYKQLYGLGKRVLKAVLELGYDAKLSFYILHEENVIGEY